MVWFCGLCSHSRGALNWNSGKVHRWKICLSHQINSVSFIHVHKNPNTILLDGHTLNLLFPSLKISQYVFSSVLSRVFAELPLKNPEANFYKKNSMGSFVHSMPLFPDSLSLDLLITQGLKVPKHLHF